MAVEFDIFVSESEDGHVVKLSGELDIVNAEAVTEALVEAASSAVVVDLTDLRFIDSTGIGAIIRARQQILAMGDELHLRGATGEVRRVFELTGLTELLAD